jgi:hypothetical protein
MGDVNLTVPLQSSPFQPRQKFGQGYPAPLNIYTRPPQLN